MSDKKTDLFENKELLDVMESAGEENYAEAVKKISDMESQEVILDDNQNAADENLVSAQKMLEEYKKAKDGVFIEYDLNGDEVAAALKEFQKKTLYKKNIIYTVLLGIIVLIYMIDIVVKPENIVGYIFSLGCLLLIYFIWYLPYRHLKSTKAATDAVDDIFKAQLYYNCIFVGQDDDLNHIPFTPKSFVVESDKSFIIGINKEKLFQFPFRCMKQEDIEQTRVILKSFFKEKYEIKNEVRVNG